MQRFKISDMEEYMKEWWTEVWKEDLPKLIELYNYDIDSEEEGKNWYNKVVKITDNTNIDTKQKLKELIIKITENMQETFKTSDGRTVNKQDVINIVRHTKVNLVDKLVLKVTAPGLTKEDVKVSIKGNELEGLTLFVSSTKEADMGFGLIVGIMELPTKGFILQGIYVEVVNGIIFVNIPKVGVVDIEVPMVSALEGKKELKPKSK